MLHYVLSRGRLKNKEAFLKFVSKEFGQERGAEMMTLAEQFKAEGFQEGEKRGEKLGEKRGEKKGMIRTKLEMAAKLIREGLDLPFVAKVTELPMSRLQELAESSVE